MQWLWDSVGQALSGLLVDVLVLLLALAAGYAVRYLRRLADRLEQQAQHELADAAIRRVGQLAEQVVLSLESTTAKRLREAVADGKLDRKELEALGPRAVDEVLRSLNAEAIQQLQGLVGDVRAYVRREVEARLEWLKAQGIIASAQAVAEGPKAPSSASAPAN